MKVSLKWQTTTQQKLWNLWRSWWTPWNRSISVTFSKYICFAIFVLSCLRYGECDDKWESELPQHQGDHLSAGVTPSQRSVLLSYCDREQHFLRAGTPAGGLWELHPEVSLPGQRETGGEEDGDDSGGDQHIQPARVLRVLQVHTSLAVRQ